jgi:hypothetical protein
MTRDRMRRNARFTKDPTEHSLRGDSLADAQRKEIRHRRQYRG